MVSVSPVLVSNVAPACLGVGTVLHSELEKVPLQVPQATGVTHGAARGTDRVAVPRCCRYPPVTYYRVDQPSSSWYFFLHVSKTRRGRDLPPHQDQGPRWRPGVGDTVRPP